MFKTKEYDILDEQKIEDNYPKAYKEVIEILYFLPQESVNKILQTLINMFKVKMDKNYDFEIDISKNF